MNVGLRTHRSASLRIAIAEGLPDDMRVGTREILSIRSTSGRQGHASALLHKVCAEADKLGMVLLLQVKPYEDGLTERQLVSWYSRFSFVVIQREPEILMARQPAPRTH